MGGYTRFHYAQKAAHAPDLSRTSATKGAPQVGKVKTTLRLRM